MNKNIVKITLFLLAIAIIVMSPTSIYANTDENMFSKQEIAKDVEFLFNRLENVHPNLYFSISKEEVEGRVQEALRDIDNSIDDVEIYKRIAPILSILNDGHTFINYPQSFIQKVNLSDNIIPLGISVKDKKLFVANVLNEEHFDRYKNYEILSINSKESIDIYNEMKCYVFGSQNAFRESSMSKMFINLYYLNNKFEDEYTIKLKDSNEKTVTLKVPGQSIKEIRTFLSTKSENRQRKLYEYKVLEDNIALIEFNSFSDFNGFKDFLDETFKDINNRGIKELIIDLRQNGGGNSSLGDLLVEYIYDGNYKSGAKMDLKVSQELIDYYQENNYLSEDELNTFKEMIGERYSFNPSATRSFMENPVFDGDTYFLIGKNTFSSAVMLSATVKDYNMGYLIGEETGGLATHYGDIYSFTLPNTKLAVGVSHKYFVRPNGLDTGKGVLPDYYEKDINKDALDIAIDIIKSKRQ